MKYYSAAMDKTVGRQAGCVPTPQVATTSLALMIAEPKVEARRTGLTDIDIEVELAAYNAERRDRGC